MIHSTHLSFFASLLPTHAVLQTESELQAYLTDKGGLFQQMPVLVLLPESTEQCAEIVKYAYQNDLKLTLRGGEVAFVGELLPMKVVSW
ncbi:MAG: FAD-binding oxidoreductase [Bacteroidia bacterium]